MEGLIDVAAKRTQADLVIKNAKVVDVFNGRIIEGDVAVYKGKIAGVGDYSARNEYDAKGCYLMGGFIDAHVHIESSMVVPAEYARIVMPHGVTSVVCDPHEIANVCGIDGIKYMMDSAKASPMDFNFMLPSCVPAADFEDSGAVIDAEMTEKYLKEYNFLGLAEMMNYPGVVNKAPEVLRKLAAAGIIDGHAPSLTGADLCAYAAAGIMTDHECTSAQEMEEKIANGMYALLRCGRMSREFSEMAAAVNRSNASRVVFCTDDRYLGDIVKSGTIQNCIITAVAAGMDIFDAIRAATLNAALCYGLKNIGAVAPGYNADLVLCSELCPKDIIAVWKNGELCAENGRAMFDSRGIAECTAVKNTVRTAPFSADDLVCSFSSKVPVISIEAGSLGTKKMYCDNADGLSHLAVIERHKASGKIGRAYVRNYGITGGAIASCIGHDSHNITVAGDNAEDMAAAVAALGKSGGIAVVSKGETLALLELGIGGLMSEQTAEEVIAAHGQLERAAERLCVNPELDPFMTLAFLPLPVIPELRLTARGLFDVTEFKFVQTEE